MDYWKLRHNMPKVKKPEEKTEAKKTTKTEVKKTSGLTVPVFDLNGNDKGSLELPKEAFSVTVKPSLLAQAIRVYQSNQRQGTASTKTRGEIIGSTRKIYRQKGTGRARHGSIKAPIFIGGGIVGGPRPRDFSLKINQKQKRKAFFGALTLKLKEKNIFGLVDKALTIEPKTKIVNALIRKIGFEKEKVLFVLPKMEKNNFVLAVRNLEKISYIDAVSLNIFQIFNYTKLIFLESALEVFKKHFIKSSK